MTAHDKEFAKKITAYLDAGNRELRSGTAYRLQQARAAALARIPEARSAPEMALAGHGGTVSAGGRPFYAQARVWIGVLLIGLAGFGWQQWQLFQTVQEAEEIDTQLLSSDLPIDAYLDRGFQVWLRTAAQR
ncbi:MAG: DUF3619 family protein [Betaproteobacteria bacterium]